MGTPDAATAEAFVGCVAACISPTVPADSNRAPASCKSAISVGKFRITLIFEAVGIWRVGSSHTHHRKGSLASALADRCEILEGTGSVGQGTNLYRDSRLPFAFH